MTNDELGKLAKAWVGYWQAPKDSERRRELEWAVDQEWDLVREEPEQAWLLILEILRQDSSAEIMELLSAGPLEDVLAKHGDAFIERVESEAASNPTFAWLLGGVWKNAMTDEVWNRVHGAWDRRGWDGTPIDDPIAQNENT